LPVPKQKTSLAGFLDPVVVSKLGRMELKARLIVEGFIAGMHRSPYHGFSVEFAEYRQYMQGDNIKNLDWKVYAKTDRFYIKEFEEETNLKATILLDRSGSMGFSSAGSTGAESGKTRRRGEGETAGKGAAAREAVSKLTYGKLLAASLAYLMIKQHDAAGLCIFDEEIRTLIPHRSVRRHLLYLLSSLENTDAGEKTAISPTLHKIAERVKRRGLVILISDLMDDPEDVLMGLKHFRHRQHEVIVFHVLDRMEVDLDYRDEVEFIDLESGKRMRAEPAFLREGYAKAVEEWIAMMSKGCKEHQIDYNLVMTDTPFDAALTAYLNKRRRLG